MDPISDFLNTFKMASRAKKDSFIFPASKLILAIAGALEKKGYLASYKKLKKGRHVEYKLPSSGAGMALTSVKRVSHLSKRSYVKARDIYPVRSGFGVAVLSTSKGILLDAEARKAKVGGEILFEIW